MKDKIEQIQGSIIQHGKFNDRIYLMKLDRNDYPEIVEKLESIAKENNYSKIFAKIPEDSKQEFLNRNYEIEASIPNFFADGTKALFLGKFIDPARKNITDKKRVEEVIEVAQSKNTLDSPPKLRAEFSYEILDKSSASEIADIYKKVFDTYPFPIHNPEYIKKTMDENFIYFGIREQDKLVGISSSEMDEEEKNVEMTDFAVLPEYRGNSFAVFLLQKMEEKMKAKGINTFFTIARAVSFGMNATFAKMGYHYSGTLVKNTNISGNIESMNIWYKSSEEIIK